MWFTKLAPEQFVKGHGKPPGVDYPVLEKFALPFYRAVGLGLPAVTAIQQQLTSPQWIAAQSGSSITGTPGARWRGRNGRDSLDLVYQT